MCDSCWDLDRREFALKMSGCDGNLTPFMTIEEMKLKLVEKWKSTNQTAHMVIKEAIIDPPDSSLVWFEPVGENNQLKFQVKFV